MGVIERVPFEDWYRQHHPRLASALVVFTRDPVVAADAADEAFARALEHWDRVGAMESPEGWTYRTALNSLRRVRRRAAIELRLIRRAAPIVVESPSGWDRDLLDAIAELPVRQRMAVALRYVADLSLEDTAAAMDVAPGTVAATVHAARSNLARKLSRYQQDPLT